MRETFKLQWLLFVDKPLKYCTIELNPISEWPACKRSCSSPLASLWHLSIKMFPFFLSYCFTIVLLLNHVFKSTLISWWRYFTITATITSINRTQNSLGAWKWNWYCFYKSQHLNRRVVGEQWAIGISVKISAPVAVIFDFWGRDRFLGGLFAGGRGDWCR